MLDIKMTTESDSAPSKPWDLCLGVILGISLVFLTVTLLPDLNTIQMDRRTDSSEGVNPDRGADSRAGVNLDRNKRGAHQEEENLDSMASHFLNTVDLDLHEKDLRYLREVTARNLVHVSVLTHEHHLVEYMTAIQLTWAAQLSAVHFLYSGSGSERVKLNTIADTVMLPGLQEQDTHTTKHVLHSIEYLCNNHIEDYHWFVMVTDTTYINTQTLRSVLERIASGTNIVIAAPDSCSLERGIIFSQRVLSSMCPRLWECHNTVHQGELNRKQGPRDRPHDRPHDSVDQSDDSSFKPHDPDNDITSCLREIAHIECSPSSQISDDFHTKLGDPLQPESLSDSMGFISPVTPVSSLYDIHRHYTQRIIERTEQEKERITAELRSNSLDKPLRKQKQKRLMPSDREADGLNVGEVMEEGAQQFYQYIDEKGKMYLDTCPTQSVNLYAQGGDYDLARLTAEEAIGQDVDKMQSFAYREVKPNVGVEYQFYFLDVGSTAYEDESHDKLHHVTVTQNYGKFDIVEKYFQPMRTLDLILPIDSTANLEKVFKHVNDMCINSKHGSGKRLCTLHVIMCGDNNIRPLRGAVRHLRIQYSKLLIKHHTYEGSKTDLSGIMKKLIPLFSEDALFVFMTNETLLQPEFIYSCISNTVPRRTAFFPVPFHLTTKTGVQETHIDKDNGKWDNENFETFCIYKTDLQAAVNDRVSFPKSAQDIFRILQLKRPIKLVRQANKYVLSLYTPSE